MGRFRALETFQLTLIPLEMTKSGDVALRIAGRLLGTTFSWLDLAAYFVGIAAALLVVYQMIKRHNTSFLAMSCNI